MALSESVERWQSCRWSNAVGFHSKKRVTALIACGDLSRGLTCGKSEIIDEGIDGQKFPSINVKSPEGWVYQVVILSELVDLESPTLSETLDRICGICPYFYPQDGR